MKGDQPKTNAHVVLLYFDPKDYKQLEEQLIHNGAERSGRGLLGKEAALMRMVRKFKKLTAAGDRD